METVTAGLTGPVRQNKSALSLGDRDDSIAAWRVRP